MVLSPAIKTPASRSADRMFQNRRECSRIAEGGGRGRGKEKMNPRGIVDHDHFGTRLPPVLPCPGRAALRRTALPGTLCRRRAPPGSQNHHPVCADLHRTLGTPDLQAGPPGSFATSRRRPGVGRLPPMTTRGRGSRPSDRTKPAPVMPAETPAPGVISQGSMKNDETFA